MTPSHAETIVIATRESRLALWQAHHVRDLLEQRFALQVSLLGMTTRGDQILDRTLSKVGGKGLFVKELEAALEAGQAQLAVHSLKDVPMDLPAGFELVAVLEREDPRDAFVSNRFATLAELPQGAKVGTSSLRRVVQLGALRPDLRIEPLRGNLDTRLRKLDEGQYDAIVLAAAGLMRLGAGERIRARFEPEQMLPCAGQGALGLEIRSSAVALRERLSALDKPRTMEWRRYDRRGGGGPLRISQYSCRIDSRRAIGGKPARDGTDGGEHGGGPDQRDRVARLESVQQRRDELRRPETDARADHDAEADEHRHA